MSSSASSSSGSTGATCSVRALRVIGSRCSGSRPDGTPPEVFGCHRDAPVAQRAERVPLTFEAGIIPPGFDVPVIGPRTLESAGAARLGVIAVEAGKTLLLETERIAELAQRLRISVVGC